MKRKEEKWKSRSMLVPSFLIYLDGADGFETGEEYVDCSLYSVMRNCRQTMYLFNDNTESSFNKEKYRSYENMGNKGRDKKDEVNLEL
jgi:hypothetical protein